jgi:hypothetical protein
MHEELLLEVAGAGAIKNKGGVVRVDRKVEGIATIAVSWQ